MKQSNFLIFVVCFVIALIASKVQSQESRYMFCIGNPPVGFNKAIPSDAYSDEKGFGFEPSAKTRFIRGGTGVRSDKPFLFSIKLTEGNYLAKITFGGIDQASKQTVRIENRRLLLANVVCPAKEQIQCLVAINVRTPKISKDANVILNDREKGTYQWDNKLTFEFNGDHPAVVSIEIEPAPELPTLFIAGDSTVTDQNREPWTGWGQMLPVFFDETIAVSNHAESGRTLASFSAQKRYEKILCMMKPGDFVMIQFGHNDMKEKYEGAGPYKNYSSLLRRYIKQAREKGGNPILVTPMHRRYFKNGKIENTLGEYPDATRKVAMEQNVPLVDLHRMSEHLFNSLGNNGSKTAFVHYPANTFKGQPKKLADNSHFNNYGGWLLARCIVKSLEDDQHALCSHILKELKQFDPAKPIPAEEFSLPASPAHPLGIGDKPEGS